MAGLREFAFKHALTRDVAYGSLPRAERRDLHRRVAEWIHARAPAAKSRRAELGAYHFAEAIAYGEDDPAVSRAAPRALSLTAGRDAFERAAFDAAEASLGRAAAFTSHFSDRLEAELLLVQIEALDGRLEQALERLDRIGPPAGDVDARAEILSWRSRLSWLTGRWEAAMQAADEAVALLSGHEESAPLARALARRSQLAMLKNLPEAVPYAREALEVARRVNDKFAEANARINLFTASAAEGVPPDPEDVLAIVGVAAEASDYEDAYRALVNVIWSGPGYLSRAAIEDMLASARERYPEIVRPRALGLYLDISLVDMLIAAGDWDAARTALAAVKRSQTYEPADLVWLSCTAALALRREGPDAAAPFLEELRPRALATLEAQRILPMAELVVPVLVLEGQAEEAQALVHEVIDVLGTRIAAPFSALGIGRALATIGADDVLRRYAETFHAGLRSGVGGRVATSLVALDALVALADGRADDAIADVAPHAERERALGWLWDATTLDLILADALAAAGRGDEEAAVRARIEAFCAANGCRYPV